MATRNWRRQAASSVAEMRGGERKGMRRGEESTPEHKNRAFNVDGGLIHSLQASAEQHFFPQILATRRRQVNHKRNFFAWTVKNFCESVATRLFVSRRLSGTAFVRAKERKRSLNAFRRMFVMLGKMFVMDRKWVEDADELLDWAGCHAVTN